MIEAQNTNPESVSSETQEANAAIATAHPEKMLPQSKVDEIVRDRMKDAYEKGKKEVLSEIEKTKSTMQETNTTQGITAEQIEEIATRAASKQQDALMSRLNEDAANKQAQTIWGQLSSKISAQKVDYPDFDDTVSKVFNNEVLPPQLQGQIFALANNVDNSGDVLYELCKNQAKLRHLVPLLVTSPKLAESAMKDLSDSISQNKKAAPVNNKEPLSQVRSSFQPADTGSKTVVDHQRELAQKFRF